MNLLVEIALGAVFLAIIAFAIRDFYNHEPPLEDGRE